MENSSEQYCLNIILNISSFILLNTNVNSTLKYYRKQTLNKRLKLIRVAMKFFMKRLHPVDIQLYDPLGYKIFFEKFVKLSGTSFFIINVHSLNAGCFDYRNKPYLSHTTRAKIKMTLKLSILWQIKIIICKQKIL